MESTPKTDEQETHHDETGEKEQDQGKDDGTRKTETYWPTKKVKKSKNKTRQKQ